MVKHSVSMKKTHRLSSIREADQIIVLKGGEEVETGIFDALIKSKGGITQNLWNSR